MDVLHKINHKNTSPMDEALLFSRFRDRINTVCLDENKECEVRLYGYFGKSITEDEKVQ